MKNEKVSNKRTYKAVPLLSGIEEIRSDFEERIAQGDCKYGIEILDDCVETIRKGSVTFIIAAPNVGKSLWGLKIAANLAKQGKKVLICSCEMGAGLLMERELRTHLGISMYALRETYAKRRDTANKLMDSLIEDPRYSYMQNIMICETGGATVEDILSLIKIEGVDYIIVDYIQRIKGSGTEYENITYAAREIQTYARDTGAVFIVCSQASRQSNIDAKYGKEVDAGRIRGKGSGSIEEDADVGLTLMELSENGDKKILATLFKNRYGNLKNISYKYRLSDRLQLILEGKDV
ncbi:MAG: DnaB helicase C-terminal domain-containing protein [Acetobacter sp.]|nr:DnaB helicase C-terminal domain-containing protein [Acetobacter sp.]